MLSNYLKKYFKERKITQENIDIILLNKIIIAVLILSTFTIMIVSIIGESLIKKDKVECYENYITDNIILKKCEIYFENLEEKNKLEEGG